MNKMVLQGSKRKYENDKTRKKNYFCNSLKSLCKYPWIQTWGYKSKFSEPSTEGWQFNLLINNYLIQTTNNLAIITKMRIWHTFMIFIRYGESHSQILMICLRKNNFMAGQDSVLCFRVSCFLEVLNLIFFKHVIFEWIVEFVWIIQISAA